MKATSFAKNSAQRRRMRAARTRFLQTRLRLPRLLVHLSGKHTYAQVLSSEAKVLLSASTAEKEMRRQMVSGGNVAAAAAVGARLAEKAKPLSLGKLAFDRGGRKFAGRVRALAVAARAGGLQF